MTPCVRGTIYGTTIWSVISPYASAYGVCEDDRIDMRLKNVLWQTLMARASECVHFHAATKCTGGRRHHRTKNPNTHVASTVWLIPLGYFFFHLFISIISADVSLSGTAWNILFFYCYSLVKVKQIIFSFRFVSYWFVHGAQRHTQTKWFCACRMRHNFESCVL